MAIYDNFFRSTLLVVVALIFVSIIPRAAAITEVRGNALGYIPPDMFNLIDKNRDGFISREEATEFLTKQGADPSTLKKSLDEIWRVNDANHDGVISWEEFRGPKQDYDTTVGNERGYSGNRLRLRRGSRFDQPGSAAVPVPTDAPGYSPRSENPNYVASPFAENDNQNVFDEDQIAPEDNFNNYESDNHIDESQTHQPESFVGKRLLIEVENCQDENNPSCLYQLHQDSQTKHLFYCTSPQKCFILQLDANLE